MPLPRLPRRPRSLLPKLQLQEQEAWALALDSELLSSGCPAVSPGPFQACSHLVPCLLQCVASLLQVGLVRPAQAEAERVRLLLLWAFRAWWECQA